MECDGQKKHSTSYFPGTGKRHGLVVVVVSRMALGEFRGNVEGYIVWTSISLRRNTFNFSQESWNENSPGAADALWGESKGSRCHRFGVRSKYIMVNVSQGDFNLQTNT